MKRKGRSRRPVRQQGFVFEVTQRCNHDCLHCYNVWKNPVDYPAGELTTGPTLAMLGDMLDQTKAPLVSVSGGEPLLREDLFEIVDFLAGRGVNVNLISNGALMDDAAIERFEAGKVSLFELPLLSADRAIHDRLSGAAGAFDRTTFAIAGLGAAGHDVVCVFVATKLNLHTWRETAELAIALGARGIMFNRFNPGGRGRDNVAALQASPAELAAALDTAQEITDQYGVSVSCSIAMPPCLFDTARWPDVGFGFCSAGTKSAYYTLDPLGNVRPCNHSAVILGNIRETPFAEMVASQVMSDFMAARPESCGGCAMEAECLGGCKAAAEVCCGSVWESDPFLAAYAGEAVKPTRRRRRGR